MSAFATDETHMAMEGLGSGADLNETASEDPASWDHLGRKGQLANEGEQLPICALDQGGEDVELSQEKGQLVRRPCEDLLGRIILHTKERSVEGGVRFSSLVATPSLSQRASMPEKVERQVLVRDGPAIKKSSK